MTTSKNMEPLNIIHVRTLFSHQIENDAKAWTIDLIPGKTSYQLIKRKLTLSNKLTKERKKSKNNRVHIPQGDCYSNGEGLYIALRVSSAFQKEKSIQDMQYYL